MMKKILAWFLLLCLPAAMAQTHLGPISITTEDQKGFSSPPPLPPAGFCRSYFDLNSGSVLWINHAGTACNAGPATSNAGSIQGNPVSPGVVNIPGDYYAINAAGTAFEGRHEAYVDVVSCGLPTNQTDAWPTMKACQVAHPGATFLFHKLINGAGLCDYNFSQSLWAIGTGQTFLGRSSGASNQGLVTLCWTTPGTPGIIALNQTSSAATIQGLALKGAETWTRTNIATFVPPFGFSYPGVVWTSGVTSAGGSTITTNGTNEAWTNQTDAMTVEVYGAGAGQGTVAVQTTANNSTVTCSCTTSMIGFTVAVPGAGVGSGVLYAKIVGIVNANNGATTGNAYIDVPPSFSVASVSSQLTLPYFGTISSHSSASIANVTPTITTAVSNTQVYVGSRADGFSCSAVGCQAIGNQITAFGRDGIRIVSGGFGSGTGSASQLADSTWMLQNLIQSNRGNGVFIQGGDSNVGHYQGGTISANQYWGDDDTDFLGDSASDINAATQHNDCHILPCPSLGGATGGFLNSTATWLDGLPYTSAAAPPFLVTDGTCVDGSTTITTAATGKFKQGHADSGTIIKLTNCGLGGAADITTFVTGFTSANSVTVADAPTCGGSCPAATAATIQAYQTITTTSGNNFDPAHVGHSALIATAGPDGQFLVTTIAIFYSTRKVGLNAAAKNKSLGNQSMYFGTSDYTGEQNWYKAWDFSSGALTSGTATLTSVNANDLFLTTMCNVLQATRRVVTVKGAGPGGTDHVTTCSTFTNSHAVTLTDASSTTAPTVSGIEVQVGQDGGPYRIASAGGPSVLIDGYMELDQLGHGPKFGPVLRTLGGLTVVAPAVVGMSSYSPLGTYNSLLNPSFGNYSDAGGVLQLFAGKNAPQQIDFTFCGLIISAGVCPKAARISLTSTGSFQEYVNEILAFNFVPGAFRDYKGDTGISSGAVHRWTGNTNGQELFAMNADASFVFGCNSASANCTTVSPVGNTVARAQKTPDAAGTFLVTGNGNTPVQTKRVTTGSILTTARNSVTVTWTTAFADANYTPVCTVLDATTGTSQGLVFERLSAVIAASITATVFNPTGGSLTGTLQCTAIHD